MTKYIELEALKNRFKKRLVWLKKDIHDEYSLGLYDGCEYDTKLIDEIPTADVAPVRHGRWVSVPHKLARACSVCNRDEPYKFADIDADVYDYCPSCGAKMDGGADNG